MRIKSIKKMGIEQVYDLEIKDNHNFFANDILVHNCLYQEQTMAIFNKIGGFSLEETDNVRKLMKKLGKADKDPEDIKKWEKIVKKFTKNAVENGLKEQEAKFVANDLVKMSAYNFNKSHSSAYSYIAIMTLYLSYYFQKYFLSSELELEFSKDKNLIDTVSAIKGKGFKLLPPDVNKSEANVSALEEDKIILGLSNVKQVSEKAAENIIANRPYENLFDFIIKIDGRYVKVGAIKALVSVGAFDFEDPNRKKLLQLIETFWEKKKSTKVVEKLKLKWEESLKVIENIPGIKTSLLDLKKYEKEYFGVNIFASVFTDKMREMFREMKERKLVYFSLDEVDKTSKKVPVTIESMRKIVDRNGNEMAFISVEDVNGKMASVPVFASYWKFISDKLEEDKIYLMNLFLDDKGDILFGQRGWIDNPNKVQRMIKEV